MRGTQIGIFIQARRASTRLPDKIYAALPAKGPASVLEHIYRRLSKRVKQNSAIVAVLIPQKDQHLRDWCQESGMQVFCGPEFDVRKRYRQAAQHFGVDIVVRATGDNPCVDPDIAFETIEGLKREQADIFSYANLPLGVAVEAMSTKALLQDVIQDSNEHREHVSVHIKQSPEIFKCCHPNHEIMKEIISTSAHSASSDSKKQNLPLRLTLDTPEDLEVIRAVFASLGGNFRLSDILQLYRRYPDLFSANQHVEQIKLKALAS